MDALIEKLLQSDEPSIRYKTRVNVLGEDPASPEIRRLQQVIRESPRTAILLQSRDAAGRLKPVRQPYRKWQGAHWVLASLADIGYPKNDTAIFPIIDQVLDCWLHPDYYNKVPNIAGRYRRCASQQGNILLATLRLSDHHGERAAQLAQLLVKWQWPDGGWNCDVRPDAHNSSFWESWLPLRALAAYARQTNDPEALAASRRAAEIFLSRHLYLKRSTGEVMHPDFIRLHYPCYWHYDILTGLKTMTEAGFIGHPACAQALDLLESKQLPDGGWPAEAKYYRIPKSQPTRPSSNIDRIAWGESGKARMNEWVTVDACQVLKAAGRLYIG